MAKKKKKYHYNPETLTFEEVKVSFRSVSRKVVAHLFASSFIGFMFFLAFTMFFDSPEERQLKHENKNLEIEYRILNKKLDEMGLVMQNLQQRDNNLYRVIFQADSIPEQLYHKTPAGNHYFEDIEGTRTAAILRNTIGKADDLEKQMYIQSRSYDELAEMVQTNEEKLKHIPAIQPVLNRDLRRVASGFGYRIDPIYRTRRMHSGMDFSAPVGTEIFATGNGVVEFAGWKQGYGNTVMIDHGFGYKTLYGHMHKIYVRNNQKVSRADVIGEVGNTGKSTGPHLHYEVKFRDKNVDPLNYYFLDLSPEEYDRMIRLAQNAGQVMD